VHAIELLATAYRPLIAFSSAVDEPTGWAPTQLPGWAVCDLIFHLAADAQRALVALAQPSRATCDTDEVSYWRSWQPGTDSTSAGLRGIRISASAWPSVRGPADLFVETASAVVAVAERADLTDSVSTQGHTMTVDALLRTLVAEATVHHLDLEPTLPAPPDVSTLQEVRRVLDGLLGQPAPSEWDDIHYARLGTGRIALNAHERDRLGPLAERFPLFG
jgi:hypothetical protein